MTVEGVKRVGVYALNESLKYLLIIIFHYMDKLEPIPFPVDINFNNSWFGHKAFIHGWQFYPEMNHIIFYYDYY